MTELENHLLSALRTMSQQFKEQHRASETAQAALQDMFERTAQDNATLSKQVGFLSERVDTLSNKLRQFESLYEQNRR